MQNYLVDVLHIDDKILITKDNQFAESEFAPKVKWLANEIDDIYDPDYNDMLRVSFAHKFGRGKLGQLVSLLSGRDFEARDYKNEIKEESFQLLKEGIENFINEYNFKQFVLAIKSAGFINNKMINSKMTLDFAYILFLMLHESNEVDKTEIKRYVQKWYVMAILTGRYIGSPESLMDKDIREIKAKGFKNYFKELEEAELSDAFWNVGLVQALETTASNSPYFSAYLAAQVYKGENALFSKAEKVSDLISIAGDVHHIFPKEYLDYRKFAIMPKSIREKAINETKKIKLSESLIEKLKNTDKVEQYNMAKGAIEFGNINIMDIRENAFSSDEEKHGYLMNKLYEEI